MKERIVFGVIIIISIALLIYSFMVLPDTVIVQINSMGEAGNTLPKLLAIFIPFAISLISGIFYMINTGYTKVKYLIFSIIGLIIQVVTLFFNHIN